MKSTLQLGMLIVVLMGAAFAQAPRAYDTPACGHALAFGDAVKPFMDTLLTQAKAAPTGSQKMFLLGEATELSDDLSAVLAVCHISDGAEAARAYQAATGRYEADVRTFVAKVKKAGVK
jgi:hypothetical protein